ncbi:uncharacterized protein [Amphiura filiformis]|uniref:uncharacterized protein isoform X6 n=1 Tax=Amphiura filiformis TaxID=82378 RepID=UPI003B20EC15
MMKRRVRFDHDHKLQEPSDHDRKLQEPVDHDQKLLDPPDRDNTVWVPSDLDSRLQAANDHDLMLQIFRDRDKDPLLLTIKVPQNQRILLKTSSDHDRENLVNCSRSQALLDLDIKCQEHPDRNHPRHRDNNLQGHPDPDNKLQGHPDLDSKLQLQVPSDLDNRPQGLLDLDIKLQVPHDLDNRLQGLPDLDRIQHPPADLVNSCPFHKNPYQVQHDRDTAYQACLLFLKTKQQQHQVQMKQLQQRDSDPDKEAVCDPDKCPWDVNDLDLIKEPVDLDRTLVVEHRDHDNKGS